MVEMEKKVPRAVSIGFIIIFSSLLVGFAFFMELYNIPTLGFIEDWTAHVGTTPYSIGEFVCIVGSLIGMLCILVGGIMESLKWSSDRSARK